MDQAENKSLSLSTLAPKKGSRKKKRRVGIGEGSGNGKTCGRGQKGQKSRSGGSVPRGFEGGQMPIHRRLPKIGFTSRKKTLGVNKFRTMPVERLALLEDVDGVISIDIFASHGLIRPNKDKIKILGGGELSKKLVVEAHAFSESAKKAIEDAGGECRVIELRRISTAEAAGLLEQQATEGA